MLHELEKSKLIVAIVYSTHHNLHAITFTTGFQLINLYKYFVKLDSQK